MENINIKVVHPSDNSVIDLVVPPDIVLRDVISQLAEAGFLTPSETYKGTLKPSGERTNSVALDNSKTVAENGIGNNDTIQLSHGFKAGSVRH